MENRIRTVYCQDRRLDPAQSEVWITVVPECLISTTEVRGRLMGPRCPYSTTVEVAYPLRELRRVYASEGMPRLIMRVIIPEASLWDPESPFLYHGPLELWQEGERHDQVQVSHGLRVFTRGSRGLRVNARPLELHGKACDHCSEKDARRWRQAGYNTLLVPGAANAAALCTVADQFGFLLLARLTRPDELPQAAVLLGHPSCLGWLLAPELLQNPLVVAALPFPAASGQLLGVELKSIPAAPLPQGVSFLACPADALPELAQVGLPTMILRQGNGTNGVAGRATAASAGVLGWLDQ